MIKKNIFIFISLFAFGVQAHDDRSCCLADRLAEIERITEETLEKVCDIQENCKCPCPISVTRAPSTDDLPAEINSIAGKFVVVTGGSRGYGRADGELFTDAGAIVVGTSRCPEAYYVNPVAFEIVPGKLYRGSANPADFVDGKTRNFAYLALLDVRYQTPAENPNGNGSVDDFVSILEDNAMTIFGQPDPRVDVLINNAGILGFGVLASTTVEELNSFFETNLWGVHRITRGLWQYIPQTPKSRVITMGSISGEFATQSSNIAMYAMAKRALQVWNVAFPAELKNVQVIDPMLPPGTPPTFVLIEPTGANTDIGQPIPDFVNGDKPQFMPNEVVGGLVEVMPGQSLIFNPDGTPNISATYTNAIYIIAANLGFCGYNPVVFPGSDPVQLPPPMCAERVSDVLLAVAQLPNPEDRYFIDTPCEEECGTVENSLKDVYQKPWNPQVDAFLDVVAEGVGLLLTTTECCDGTVLNPYPLDPIFGLPEPVCSSLLPCQGPCLFPCK